MFQTTPTIWMGSGIMQSSPHEQEVRQLVERLPSAQQPITLKDVSIFNLSHIETNAQHISYGIWTAFFEMKAYFWESCSILMQNLSNLEAIANFLIRVKKRLQGEWLRVDEKIKYEFRVYLEQIISYCPNEWEQPKKADLCESTNTLQKGVQTTNYKKSLVTICLDIQADIIRFQWRKSSILIDMLRCCDSCHLLIYRAKLLILLLQESPSDIRSNLSRLPTYLQSEPLFLQLPEKLLLLYDSYSNPSLAKIILSLLSVYVPTLDFGYLVSSNFFQIANRAIMFKTEIFSVVNLIDEILHKIEVSFSSVFEANEASEIQNKVFSLFYAFIFRLPQIISEDNLEHLFVVVNKLILNFDCKKMVQALADTIITHFKIVHPNQIAQDFFQNFPSFHTGIFHSQTLGKQVEGRQKTRGWSERTNQEEKIQCNCIVSGEVFRVMAYLIQDLDEKRAIDILRLTIIHSPIPLDLQWTVNQKGKLLFLSNEHDQTSTFLIGRSVDKNDHDFAHHAYCQLVRNIASAPLQRKYLEFISILLSSMETCYIWLLLHLRYSLDALADLKISFDTTLLINAANSLFDRFLQSQSSDPKKNLLLWAAYTLAGFREFTSLHSAANVLHKFANLAKENLFGLVQSRGEVLKGSGINKPSQQCLMALDLLNTLFIRGRLPDSIKKSLLSVYDHLQFRAVEIAPGYHRLVLTIVASERETYQLILTRLIISCQKIVESKASLNLVNVECLNFLDSLEGLNPDILLESMPRIADVLRILELIYRRCIHESTIQNQSNEVEKTFIKLLCKIFSIRNQEFIVYFIPFLDLILQRYARLPVTSYDPLIFSLLTNYLLRSLTPTDFHLALSKIKAAMSQILAYLTHGKENQLTLEISLAFFQFINEISRRLSYLMEDEILTICMESMGFCLIRSTQGSPMQSQGIGILCGIIESISESTDLGKIILQKYGKSLLEGLFSLLFNNVCSPGQFEELGTCFYRLIKTIIAKYNQETQNNHELNIGMEPRYYSADNQSSYSSSAIFNEIVCLLANYMIPLHEHISPYIHKQKIHMLLSQMTIQQFLTSSRSYVNLVKTGSDD